MGYIKYFYFYLVDSKILCNFVLSNKENEIKYYQYVLHDAGEFRRARYCIVLNFKNITIKTSANRGGFLFYARFICSLLEIKKNKLILYN